MLHASSGFMKLQTGEAHSFRFCTKALNVLHSCRLSLCVIPLPILTHSYLEGTHLL